MNKNYVKIYLLVVTAFAAIIVFLMPVPLTKIIFGGILIVNLFLFLDVMKKD